MACREITNLKTGSLKAAKLSPYAFPSGYDAYCKTRVENIFLL
jgi:hypothetical protein